MKKTSLGVTLAGAVAAILSAASLPAQAQTVVVGSLDDLTGPTSANGTRAYSACPPAYPPRIWL